MKTTRTALTLATFATLALFAGVAQAGVNDSKHDLGTGGLSQGDQSTSGEVCVFCHTPHGSDSSAAVPLWNKAVAASGAYTQYGTLGTTSLDGTEAGVGSVSLACLTCHDGTQAMDVVINAPGSGGYNATGAEYQVAAGPGVISGVPNLGLDLTNDHPISIQYGGGGYISTDADGTYAADLTKDVDFIPATKEGTVWWVDTSGGTAGTKEKTDMVLYTRTFDGATQPSVECASCHDPHNAASTPVSFMRIDNTNSAVCLACHEK